MTGQVFMKFRLQKLKFFSKYANFYQILHILSKMTNLTPWQNVPPKAMGRQKLTPEKPNAWVCT